MKKEKVQKMDLSKWDLDKIIPMPDVAKLVKKIADKPAGLLLVTGPMGSGKSTLLYMCAKYISDKGGHWEIIKK